MKRKIVAVFLILLMSIIGVNAEEDTIEDPGTSSGDPIYGLIYDELSFWDKLKIGSKEGLTVIGGAECSIYPDFGKDYTPSSSGIIRLCHTNDNHKGVAFQLFKLTSTGYVYIGEKQVLQGEKECFNVQYGTKYHYDLYYCDGEVVCGGQFFSECHTETQTKRTRVCNDNSIETEWVNYVDNNAPWCFGSEPLPPSPDVPPLFGDDKASVGVILIGVAVGGVVGGVLASVPGLVIGAIIGGAVGFFI